MHSLSVLSNRNHAFKSYGTCQVDVFQHLPAENSQVTLRSHDIVNVLPAIYYKDNATIRNLPQITHWVEPEDKSQKLKADWVFAGVCHSNVVTTDIIMKSRDNRMARKTLSMDVKGQGERTMLAVLDHGIEELKVGDQIWLTAKDKKKLQLYKGITNKCKIPVMTTSPPIYKASDRYVGVALSDARNETLVRVKLSPFAYL